MAEEKVGTKLTAIGGQVANYTGNSFKKIKHTMADESTAIISMNNGKIMVNRDGSKRYCATRSGYDELKALIKQWRSPTPYSIKARVPAIDKEGVATGLAHQQFYRKPTGSENRKEVAGVKEQTGANLHEKVECLMASLEASGAGTFCWDLRADAIMWDGLFDRLFALQPGKSARSLDEFLGLVHPDDRSDVMDRCGRCRLEGGDFETEFRVILPDERIRWLYGRGKTIIEDGHPAYLTGVCLDITERKATEMQRESEARFHTLDDLAPVMIWMSAPDKRCTWFNQPWLNFVGRSMEQELGSGWVENVHTDDAALCCDAYNQAFDARMPFSRSYRLKRHDGEYRWLLDKAIPMFAPASNFTGYMGCCIDITEQKRVEEVLREKNQRKDEFLANMSHEVRSPMTSILAYADVLLSHLDDPDDIQCVKTIKQGGNHLLELISDILDLSKIGSGKLKIKKGIVSIHKLLNEVHSLIAVRAQEKNLSLILKYEGAIPENIETDHRRLRQILLNLVSNAVRFTETGSVQIIARFLPQDAVLDVAVTDTGVGISEEQQGRLFQPFMQTDSAKTRGHEGTGLGLAITKQLVDMLGGEISFESVPNCGSTFRVRMPVAAVPATANGVTHVANCAPSRRRIKILLVDDNQLVCKALCRLLEMAGHEVLVAFDGQSALEKAQEFQADVAVLDLKLPDMGGYELLAQLKGLRTFQKAKSIALTGYGEESCPNEGVEFDHFLTKPVDAKELEDLF
jgi:PAS domain S-box-containing protein